MSGNEHKGQRILQAEVRGGCQEGQGEGRAGEKEENRRDAATPQDRLQVVKKMNEFIHGDGSSSNQLQIIRTTIIPIKIQMENYDWWLFFI